MYEFIKNYKGSDGFIASGTKVKKADKHLIERGIVRKISNDDSSLKNGAKK